MKFAYMEILYSPLGVIVLSAFTLQNVYCTCDSENAVEYVPIQVKDYDRNYSSISSVDKHPLGFNQSTWYYENAGSPNPCFKITGASKRRIEIMYETFPPSRLCINFQGRVICSESGTGRFYRCLRSGGNTVYIEFFCDSQCGEEDIRFWYRFVLGNVTVSDKDDLWCDDRNRDDYPENLKRLPPNFPLSPRTTTPAGKAACLSSSILASLIVMCLAFFA